MATCLNAGRLELQPIHPTFSGNILAANLDQIPSWFAVATTNWCFHGRNSFLQRIGVRNQGVNIDVFYASCNLCLTKKQPFLGNRSKMPIFKVSIFKTSFLTGNPWNFLQKTHQVGNHPTVCWTSINANAILFHMCFCLHKNFLMFFQTKRINKSTSPPTQRAVPGLRGRPVTLTLPCHDRKWHGQPAEIRSFSQTS